MGSLLLRKMQEEDCALLYAWRNDPETRRQSFHTEEIAYPEHETWFSAMLADPAVRGFILEEDGKPVGQFRIRPAEGTEHIGEISFAVAPGERGRGLGTRILAEAEEALRHERPAFRTLLGRVKESNPASRKAFLRNGYREEREEEGEGVFRYTKTAD